MSQSSFVSTVTKNLPSWDHICNAVPVLFDPFNIFLMVCGLTGGIIIGSLPGLTATMGVALMVPITFKMNATSAIVMLGAIYIGAIYGGANSAILIKTPGTPSSVATTFDGWPLCQQGKADVGLYASLISSSLGTMFGATLLLFLAVPLSKVAVQFGAAANFWLCIFGLSTIAVMSSGNMLKGVLSGLFGLLCATVGLAQQTGEERFTFGVFELSDGIEAIPAMIGLFSFSQVLVLVASNKQFIANYKPTKGAFTMVFKQIMTSCKKVLARSSIIGGFVGILPGAGGEIASIIAYNEAKRWDKNPEKYGKGAIEGVVASESANNAVIGGALIPMLTLGIPGSAVAAVMLGALMTHQIIPGAKVFTESAHVAYPFMLSQYVVSLLMLPVGYILAKFMARLLGIRLTLVTAGIVVLSAIGAYAIKGDVTQIWIAIAFGFIGYFMMLLRMDTGAMALGIILGSMIEEHFSTVAQFVQGSDKSIMGEFLDNKIAVTFMVLSILSMLTPAFIAFKQRRKQKAAEKAAAEGYSVACTANNTSIMSVLGKEDEQKPEPLSNIISALLMLVVVGIFVIMSFDYTAPQDASTFAFLQNFFGEAFTGEGVSATGLRYPLIIMWALGIGSVLLLGFGLFQLFCKTREKVIIDKAAMLRVVFMSACVFGYALLISFAGFFPASIVFVFGVNCVLYQAETVGKKLFVSFTYSVGLAFIIWLTFSLALETQIAEGWLASDEAGLGWYKSMSEFLPSLVNKFLR